MSSRISEVRKRYPGFRKSNIKKYKMTKGNKKVLIRFKNYLSTQGVLITDEQIEQFEKIYKPVQESKLPRFRIPDIQEVIKDFTSKGSDETEANKFFYFYESKNWMVGKTKMKNWYAAVSGWLARNKKAGTKKYTYGTSETW